MLSCAMAMHLLFAAQSFPSPRYSRAELPPGMLKPPTQVVEYDFMATFLVEPSVIVEQPYRHWSGQWGTVRFGVKATRMTQGWSMAEAIDWMKAEPAQRGQVIQQQLYGFASGCPGNEVAAQVRQRDGCLLRLRLIAMERPPRFFYQVYSVVPERELDRTDVEAEAAEEFVAMFYPCLSRLSSPSRP